VYSISGAQVYQTKLNASAGINNISVPVQQLQNGAYVLMLKHGNGTSAIKFIKN
jgi:hypothetical protein